MIILDTNILSELMRPAPNAQVETWLDQQIITELFITTISIAEISYGIHALPAGKRRTELENAFQQSIAETFTHRTLFFDEKAAHTYGILMAKRKALGKPMGILDGQIAAIACAHSAVLATRNIADFADCDLAIINPFISLSPSQ